MRFLPEWLTHVVGDAKFDQTVERIVHSLQPAALHAITVHGQRMSGFEARGYIRARTGLMVSRGIAAEIEGGVAVKHRRRLTDAVREQLIQILLPQVVPATPIEVTSLPRAA